MDDMWLKLYEEQLAKSLKKSERLGACKFLFESILWAHANGFPELVKKYAADGIQTVDQS